MLCRKAKPWLVWGAAEPLSDKKHMSCPLWTKTMKYPAASASSPQKALMWLKPITHYTCRASKSVLSKNKDGRKLENKRLKEITSYTLRSVLHHAEINNKWSLGLCLATMWWAYEYVRVCLVHKTHKKVTKSTLFCTNYLKLFKLLFH